MGFVRPPAVAGLFYPADPGELRAAVERHLEEGRRRVVSPPPSLKALIAPHAGYVYSGPVAGSAYAQLEPRRDQLRRVVLFGPSHRVAFRGLALSGADFFETPLGEIPLDAAARAEAAALEGVSIRDDAHAAEHSLEVQLPFLQTVLREFTLVPVAAGDATAQEVAQLMEALWDGPETLVVVSSDLSHYYDYDTARKLDEETARAIEELRAEDLGSESACGRVPLRGLLVAARRRGLAVHRLDLRNSGDTAGPRDQVVGYGAFALG